MATVIDIDNLLEELDLDSPASSPTKKPAAKVAPTPYPALALRMASMGYNHPRHTYSSSLMILRRRHYGVLQKEQR